MPTSQQLISKTVTERNTTEVLDTVDNIRPIVKP